jgi:hypothetical protein
MILSILAGADNVVVFVVVCQENTCLGLNKDENRLKGSKENSKPNTADQGNSSYKHHLTIIQLIKQSSFNTNERYDHSTNRYDHKHLLQHCRLLKVLNGGQTTCSVPMLYLC